MIPRILEYEDGRVKVTAEAYAIPEVKAILDKYEMQAEPYLAYVHAMSAPDSPYCRVPEEDKQETVIFDIQGTMGDFDWEDDIIQIAIDKIKSLYSTVNVRMADQLEAEINSWILLLKATPPSLSEDATESMKLRMTMVQNMEKYVTTVAKVREQADKEISVRMKGTAELGEY